MAWLAMAVAAVCSTRDGAASLGFVVASLGASLSVILTNVVYDDTGALRASQPNVVVPPELPHPLLAWPMVRNRGPANVFVCFGF